jgi:aminoglycoside phosphotransferase (APT) family kinase protein
MAGNSNALLIRAIGEELAQRIMPELTSADARERSTLARLVLEQLAADLDVLPELAEQGFAAEYRQTIAAALSALPDSQLADDSVRWRAALDAIATDRGLGAQREIASLRALGADIVRRTADSGIASQPAGVAAIARLGSLDFRWLTAYDAAQRQQIALRSASIAPEGQQAASAAPTREPTPESVTQYLRRRFPNSPETAATTVVPIPGGRSKKTFFISLNAGRDLPAELVMRQDYSLRYEGTKVRDEYTPLLKLSERGLAVPRPLLLEAQESELGPPFLLVERLRGGPPGSYLFGIHTPCPGAFLELAKVLASLHRVAPAELGLSLPASGAADSLRHLIETYQTKWRDNATRASPIIDYAYAWALAECAKDTGSLAVVHGDAGPYNLLVDGDRLSALLDWEFVHVGDPAVDLGIVRVYAEEFMSWDDFMHQYAAAGGADVPDTRVRLGMLVNFLKGTTLVATSGRNFEEGWTREFVKGANSFTGLRLIELRIAALLKRLEAV